MSTDVAQNKKIKNKKKEGDIQIEKVRCCMSRDRKDPRCYSTGIVYRKPGVNPLHHIKSLTTIRSDT